MISDLNLDWNGNAAYLEDGFEETGRRRLLRLLEYAFVEL